MNRIVRHLVHRHITGWHDEVQTYPFVYIGEDEDGYELWKCPFDGSITRIKK